MSDYRDGVPGYRTIRVGLPASRAAAEADEQAWLARKTYPSMISAGDPAFGIAHELEHGGWELHGVGSGAYPQAVRDSLGWDFRDLAGRHPEGSAARAECMSAAERLGWEPLNEMTVLGTRYRIVRAEQFIRTGPVGPEPPRPSDPDPGEPGMSRQFPDPAQGFVIDPVNATGMSEGILKAELLDARQLADPVPPGAHDDLERAAQTHPGGVLLPPAFTVGTQTRGAWAPTGITAATPQGARDRLVSYLRVSLPARLDFSEDKRALCAAAADLVEQEQVNEVTAAGHRFRVVRVERLVRIGPDGPEGPRPSDTDPEPPAGQLPDTPDDDDILADDEEDGEVEYSEEFKRFIQLFEEERERKAARRARPADPRDS